MKGSPKCSPLVATGLTITEIGKVYKSFTAF